MHVDHYLDFENPAHDSAAKVYERFRSDPRTPRILEALKTRGLSDREIVILFRLVSWIPSEWEVEREAPITAIRRRRDMADRLRALLPLAEEDPDLSRLHFGTAVVSAGAPQEPEEVMVSFPECVRQAISTLEAAISDAERHPESRASEVRQIQLKRYAIRTIAELLDKPPRRAPNALTAEIASVLLDQHVTSNDVTQARKDVRRRYYRDK